MSDQLQKFDFPEHPIRGHLVSLDATWRAVLERHPYPPRVRDALGEAMAASLLLAATLKFDGTLTLQVQGDGPISLLVVQATSGMTVRGLAHWSDDKLVDDEPLFGDGRVVVTLDPRGGGERYQGIVAVERGSLSQALERYFRQSEQLPTRLWLAAGDDTVAGLLLQRVPDAAQVDSDAWNRFGLFGDTLSDNELRGLDNVSLLHRLFDEGEHHGHQVVRRYLRDSSAGHRPPASRSHRRPPTELLQRRASSSYRSGNQQAHG
jgi:molecular chaperone Hsp33